MSPSGKNPSWFGEILKFRRETIKYEVLCRQGPVASTIYLIFCFKWGIPCKKSLKFSTFTSYKPKIRAKHFALDNFLATLAHVGASGCSSTWGWGCGVGSVDPCHANSGVTSASGFTHLSYLLYLTICLPKIWKNFAAKDHGFLESRPPPPPKPRPQPTPFDVGLIYRANEETFIGHAKHYQEK